LILGEFSFWSPFRFWLLVPHQMYTWQRFSLILWTVSSTWWPFPLLYRSFWILCSSICQAFLLDAETFVFYFVSHCLCLLVPVYFLLFPELAVSFMSYIKVLNPLWVVTCTVWKMWI
jgi:hypothetical protein